MPNLSHSEWASDRFGAAVDDLLQLVPAALGAAHGRAHAAHVGADMNENDAYGHTLKLAQHQELVARVGPFGNVIRPHGSRYHLAVVGGAVLYPLRYASDRTPVEDARLRWPVSGLRRNLFAALDAMAPVPPTLFDVPLDEDLGGATDEPDPQSTRLVIVAYTSNPRSGVLIAEWGEADLLEGGGLLWRYHYPLPLQPSQQATRATEGVGGMGTGSTGPIRAVRPATPAGSRRFDDAPLDEPVLGRQSPGVSSPAEPPFDPLPTGSDQDG